MKNIFTTSLIVALLVVSLFLSNTFFNSNTTTGEEVEHSVINDDTAMSITKNKRAAKMDSMKNTKFNVDINKV